MVRKKVASPPFGIVIRAERIEPANEARVSTVSWKFQLEDRISVCFGANLIENFRWEKWVINRA